MGFAETAWGTNALINLTGQGYILIARKLYFPLEQLSLCWSNNMRVGENSDDQDQKHGGIRETLRHFAPHCLEIL